MRGGRVFAASSGVIGAPLVLAATHNPQPGRGQGAGRTDRLAAESAADAVDGPAGVARSWFLTIGQFLELQLLCRLSELRRGNTE